MDPRGGGDGLLAAGGDGDAGEDIARRQALRPGHGRTALNGGNLLNGLVRRLDAQGSLGDDKALPDGSAEVPGASLRQRHHGEGLPGGGVVLIGQDIVRPFPQGFSVPGADDHGGGVGLSVVDFRSPRHDGDEEGGRLRVDEDGVRKYGHAVRRHPTGDIAVTRQGAVVEVQHRANGPLQGGGGVSLLPVIEPLTGGGTAEAAYGDLAASGRVVCSQGRERLRQDADAVKRRLFGGGADPHLRGAVIEGQTAAQEAGQGLGAAALGGGNLNPGEGSAGEAAGALPGGAELHGGSSSGVGEGPAGNGQTAVRAVHQGLRRIAGDFSGLLRAGVADGEKSGHAEILLHSGVDPVRPHMEGVAVEVQFRLRAVGKGQVRGIGHIRQQPDVVVGGGEIGGPGGQQLLQGVEDAGSVVARVLYLAGGEGSVILDVVEDLPKLHMAVSGQLAAADGGVLRELDGDAPGDVQGLPGGDRQALPFHDVGLGVDADIELARAARVDDAVPVVIVPGIGAGGRIVDHPGLGDKDHGVPLAGAVVGKAHLADGPGGDTGTGADFGSAVRVGRGGDGSAGDADIADVGAADGGGLPRALGGGIAAADADRDVGPAALAGVHARALAGADARRAPETAGGGSGSGADGAAGDVHGVAGGVGAARAGSAVCVAAAAADARRARAAPGGDGASRDTNLAEVVPQAAADARAACAADGGKGALALDGDGGLFIAGVGGHLQSRVVGAALEGAAALQGQPDMDRVSRAEGGPVRPGDVDVLEGDVKFLRRPGGGGHRHGVGGGRAGVPLGQDVGFPVEGVPHAPLVFAGIALVVDGDRPGEVVQVKGRHAVHRVGGPAGPQGHGPGGHGEGGGGIADRGTEGHALRHPPGEGTARPGSGGDGDALARRIAARAGGVRSRAGDGDGVGDGSGFPFPDGGDGDVVAGHLEGCGAFAVNRDIFTAGCPALEGTALFRPGIQKHAASLGIVAVGILLPRF